MRNATKQFKKLLLDQVESTIVLDCGGCTCKAGHAGKNAPSVEVPTLVQGHADSTLLRFP
eukprot:2873195-Amphidinium_carterae.1